MLDFSTCISAFIIFNLIPFTISTLLLCLIWTPLNENLKATHIWITQQQILSATLHAWREMHAFRQGSSHVFSIFPLWVSKGMLRQTFLKWSMWNCSFDGFSNILFSGSKNLFFGKGWLCHWEKIKINDIKLNGAFLGNWNTVVLNSGVWNCWWFPSNWCMASENFCQNRCKWVQFKTHLEDSDLLFRFFLLKRGVAPEKCTMVDVKWWI